MDLVAKANQLKLDFDKEIAQLFVNPEKKAIEALRVNWLGRKGLATQLFDELKNVDKSDRPQAGKTLNVFRQGLEASIKELSKASESFAIKNKLNKPLVDISLPTESTGLSGSLHPITLMGNKLIEIFHRHGFTVYDGPELEYDFYNFSALNIPQDHPSRDMQDTFFLKGSENMVLRTHTSNIQIHSMLTENPPLRLVAPGRVYRVDNDATHTPMFHQLESVVVDKHISFAHLKGMIQAFTKDVFGSALKTRFRPSFFPFVEPGAEMDLECTMCHGKGCRVCSQTGWIEIGGCGMIHPNVFEAVGYDSETYTGYAFGFGIDRMAMLAFGLPDLRQLFEGDSQFHMQFPVFN